MSKMNNKYHRWIPDCTLYTLYVNDGTVWMMVALMRVLYQQYECKMQIKVFYCLALTRISIFLFFINIFIVVTRSKNYDVIFCYLLLMKFLCKMQYANNMKCENHSNWFLCSRFLSSEMLFMQEGLNHLHIPIPMTHNNSTN